MKKILSILFLVLSCCALWVNCASPTKEEAKDLEGPALTIDSMFAGTQVLNSGDTVTIDAIIIKGHINDTSGIYSITVSVGGARSTGVTFNDSLWQGTVYLRSGSNTVTIEAQDREDNKSTSSKSLYYKTDYLPISGTSFWNFRYSGADLKITSDTSWRLSQIPYLFYRMIISNAKVITETGEKSVADTFVLAKHDTSDSFRAGDSAGSAMSGDILFLKEYTPLTQAYGHAQVTFVGDMRAIGALGDTVDYRNCVQVTFSDSAYRKAYVSDFFLAPGKGFVKVRTQSLLNFNLLATQHP